MFHSSVGLLNREASQLPREYSTSAHRINCRGYALYICTLQSLPIAKYPFIPGESGSGRANEGPFNSLTLLPSCEKPTFIDLSIGVAQH